MTAYYEARAAEYDDWYRLGRFDGLDRPHWDDELHALERTLEAVPLPFPDDSFGRVFTAHFYEHLEDADRRLGGGETLFAGLWFVAGRS